MKKYPLRGARARARSLRHNMTDAERKAWRMLRLRQISGHRFRRQVPIGRYIVDFACHEARLIVEIDGSQHGTALGEETERTEFLESEGYQVLRFPNERIATDLAAVLNDIRTRLERRRPTPNRKE